MSHRCVSPRLILASVLLLAPAASAFAQRPAPKRAPANDAEAEDRRDALAMERFLTLLEKNPRRGTALDKVFGYHVERGTLDSFIKKYEDRVAKDAKDGVGWLVLGLLESQRGRDAAAVAAFRHAEEARPGDPMPSYYLGQALVLVGQPDDAAVAFERSIERKPKRNDLLEVFQALGRVYQRAQKTKEALGVWSRLEALFPADPRVREQIASALAEEGQAEQALPRYEALASSSKDPFRQAQLAMTAADLKVRLGRSEPALRDFESLLSKLRPDSWLYREVRRKIDEVFLRNDDQAGLAAYYERWIQKNPEDVEALVRLGKALAAQGRLGEARGWYEKAIKLAPSRRELRLALIGQLVQDQKFAEAAAQYEAMDKAEPNNPDTLRDWGGLLLRDTAKAEATRKADAAAVWRRLLDARPKDPVTAAQVADLFRQAELVDGALELYRKAIELAPADPQYREYLGEYLHTLKRSDEALATWRKIAEGPNRNAKNLVRLAEVLAGFGYLAQAIPPMTEAIQLDGDDFALRSKLAEMLHRAERYDEARAQLDVAETLADNDEERSAALEAQVKNDLAGAKVAARIEELRKELDAGPKPSPERWARLARYLEADGKLPEANVAVNRAIEVDPRSVRAWALAARLREAAGQLGDAADAFRKLAEIDRRNRSEYLTGVAKLEARLGRVDQALKAGRDLIAAAPGNPEHYEFYAGLCLQLGRNDEGLDALRRAVRVNPNEPKVILTLAENLAGQFRTEEAIEIYWRAFEKTEDLDGKIGVVPRLTDLYLQRNQFDRLLARLQREQGEAQDQRLQRELAICLAQAYASSGDLGMARSELERLLASNTRDTQLLKQLSKLAEEEGDLEGSAKYQKQLVELAPSDEESTRLAQLYVRFGDIEEAQGLWTRMASGQKEPHRVLQAIDSLLGNDKAKAVLEITEAMVRKDPHDWEALYREGVALAKLEKPDDASARFRALLELRTDDDDTSAIVKARRRDPKLKAAGARPSRFGAVPSTPLQDRISAVSQIRMATGLETRAYYYSSRTQAAVWAPPDFGQARMAALGWLTNLATKKGKAAEEKVLAEIRTARDKPPRDPRTFWDWYYLCAMRNENREAYEAARALSHEATSDPTALWVYLTSLAARQFGSGPQYYVAPGTEDKDGTPALAPEEITHVLACYEGLRKRRPDLVQGTVINNVAVELKRAKRAGDGDHLYREAIESADQVGPIASIFGLAGQRGDVEGLLRLFDKYDRLQAGHSSSVYSTANFYFEGPANAMGQAMSVRATEKAYGDVLRLLDHYLASARRKHEAQPQYGRASRFGNRYSPGSTPYYNIWLGRNANYVQIPFPIPNEYYDAGAITLLRTAYELYKRDDLASDLTNHFRKQADAAPTAADATYPRLALSYLAWWDDDKDVAIAEFTKVAEASKVESDLRLVLAELLEKRGDAADALAMVDSVKPLENATMQRREEQALRLAVLTGNLERARNAAERLFGLRLDTDTQVRLAGQMNQLGMHDLAESVLARARRRAGGKASALVGLMLQYQRQDKADVAIQVALQILRSTSGVRNSNPYVYNSDDPDAARTSAVQVLARSGRLKSMIERVNEQLARAPNAIQLHQALADYYKADGQRDKARAELAAIAKLRPDDANLRYQIATQLVQANQAADAVEHYKAALKKEPSLFARNYYQIQNAFQQANRVEDLVALFDELDVRSLGQSHYVTNLIQYVMNDERLRDKAMVLFRKAWDAFPQERMDLITYIRRDEFWQLPETYSYARQALLPEAGSFVAMNQWSTFQNLVSYGADGRMNGVISRILDLAASQGKLDELAGEVEAARAKMPGWEAGKAVSALIDCRIGKFDEARKLVGELLKHFKEAETSMPTALGIIGGELENYGPTRDLATTVYEGCLAERGDDPYAFLRYDSSPVKRLVRIYEKGGRKDEARQTLLAFAKPRSYSNYDQDYVNQMRMQGLASAAQELVSLGDTAGAIPLFSESIAIGESLGADAPNYIGNREDIVVQARENLGRALQGLEGDQLVETVGRLLKPTLAGDSAPKAGEGTPPKGKAAVRDQAVDLVLLVHPRDLDKSAVKSLFAESIVACARVPERLAPIEATLKSLGERYPEDFSVAIASALTAIARGDHERILASLKSLDALVESKPLDPLPAGARANARQRTEAARQIPLWLVARAAGDRESARESIDRYTARAVEAAHRQADNRWFFAILREQGQRALDQGDKKGAEAAWARMLDVILAREAGTKKKAAPAPVNPAPAPAPAQTKAVIRRTSFQAPGAGAVEAPAAVMEAPRAGVVVGPAAVKGARPANVPILTLDRFEQAMQIAKLAAEHGLPDLSLRAVREALEGGAPVPNVTNQENARVVRRLGVDNEPVDAITPRVIAQLVEIEGVWRRHKAPDDLVYQTLRDVAMPMGRPAEVFLYAQPLNANTVHHPRSLGEMLAVWAVRAGKADDLRLAIDRRRGQPMAVLPATVLTAQLELALGNAEATNASLKALGERLAQNLLRSSAELACHAALPALSRPETSTAALGVLDVGMKAFRNVINSNEPLQTLLTLLARRQLERADLEGGRKRLGEYLDALDQFYARYGGDYPVYQRKLGLQKVASEYARAGFWADALETLGRFVDAPAYSGGDPPLGSVLVLLDQHLSRQPSKARYETLKAWTMPTSTRRVVRMLATLGSKDEPPSVFLEKSKSSAPPPASRVDEVVSTASSLIAAARETGMLDALSAECATAVQQKVENAEGLQILVELGRGQGAAVKSQVVAKIAALTKEHEARSEPGTIPPAPGIVRDRQKPLTFHWIDYEVAHSLLGCEDPDLRDLGLRLADVLVERARLSSNVMGLSQLRRKVAAARAAREGSKMMSAQLDPGAGRWHPASSGSAYYSPYNEAGASPLWVAHGGMVAHVAGPASDFLLFDYPLVGTYEFSVDAYVGRLESPGVSAQGLLLSFLTQATSFRVSPVGQNETVTPAGLIRQNDLNKLTVQVAPGRVRYLVNGHLAFEDDEPSPTSPWIGLSSAGVHQSVWDHVSIQGRPNIPREVPLSHGAALEGWVSAFYNESQPQRLTNRVDPSTSRLTLTGRPSRSGLRAKSAVKTPINPDDYDWSSVDGVIRGRRLLGVGRPIARNYLEAAPSTQSRLYYFRPLRDGDVLEYEFYYEPDQVIGHPAMDRLAFQLEPEGVRLHWMTQGLEDPSGISADNAIDEPANRRGSGKLPLKAGDWNAMKIALDGDAVTLTLNGQEIYRRVLEPTNSRQFGVYHDKDKTSVQLRKVVMRGRWPETLPEDQRSDLVSSGSTGQGSAADRRARHAIIGEPYLGLEVGEVLRKARGLEPEPRLARLADWVLPNDDHPVFRLQGEFTPTNPAPTGKETETTSSPGRILTGGELRSPAIDLVDAASALGKLDELAAKVEKLDAPGDANRRGKLALLALVAIAKGDDAKAASLLAELKPMLEKVAPDDPEWVRWPDLVAASRAVARPALREQALALLETMAGQAQKKSPRPLWEHQVKNVLARGRALALTPAPTVAFGADPGIPNWASVTQTRAETRGTGEPIPSWSVRDGVFTHDPGHANDMFYLGVPLRGDFQLDCELALAPGREIRASYGGLIIGPKNDLKHLERSQYGHKLPDILLNPPLEKTGDWYKYRLTVKKGRMTSFVNGRQVFQSSLPGECDPWLAFHSPANATGNARHVEISGQPTIPDTLQLSSLPDLTGWRGDEYGESVTGENPDWDKRGDEIVGRHREDSPGSKLESVLRYHRPMLEDGEIAYEFYYEPSEAMTHPAIDRLALLLEPEGVKVHWLTDAQYERGGLAPDNTSVEPDCRKGPGSLPLKPKQWNKAALSLVGKKIALRLNGELVYERALEPSNQRSFGFFHYADETEARVRNVTYRGEWPRTLPKGLVKQP